MSFQYSAMKRPVIAQLVERSTVEGNRMVLGSIPGRRNYDATFGT